MGLYFVAICLYTSKNRSLDDFYGKLNWSLREGQTKYNKFRGILSKALYYLILHPDKARDPPKSGLYRGIGLDSKPNYANILASDKKQFASFSENLEVSCGFAGGYGSKGPGKKRFPLIFHVTGNTRNVPMAYIAPYGLPTETEWLSPAGEGMESAGRP